MKLVKLFEEFITEAINPTKKIINGIFRKNGIKTLSSNSSGMVRGWTTYHGKGYKYEYNGLITLKGFSAEEIQDLATQFREAGIEVFRTHTNGIEYGDIKESVMNESNFIEIDGQTWGTMQQNANDPDVNIIRLEIYPKSIWITYKIKGKAYRDNFYKSDKDEKNSIPTKESKQPLWLTFKGGNYECSSIKKDIYDENGKIK